MRFLRGLPAAGRYSPRKGHSPMAAPADGTVEKTRFDGLMSAYQRALATLTPEQRAILKASDTPAQSEDSQQVAAQGAGFEEGESYTFEGGRFVPYEPGTPMQHSETVSRSRPAPTIAEERAQLDRMEGKPSFTREWPDVTAR